MDFQDTGSLAGLPLADKEKISAELVARHLARAKTPVVCFSGGKKSTALLHLVMGIAAGPVTMLRVDTGCDFGEVDWYCKKASRLWGVELVEARPDAAGDAGPECCARLILEPLKKAMAGLGAGPVFLGMTHDSRSRLTRGVAGDGAGFIYPLFHFTEEDVKAYVKKYGLSACSLYGQGYENVDCRPCTPKAEKAADSADEAKVREKLRKLGYL